MKTAKEGKMKTKVMIVSGIFTMVFLFVLGFSPVNAAIPYTINYQGYLTDAMGSPVNGTVSMTFSLYTVASRRDSVMDRTSECYCLRRDIQCYSWFGEHAHSTGL